MRKGVIIVYTLIVLSILLVIAFTVISVNQSQTRSAIATDESVVAFFLAESGAETMLDRIYSGSYDDGPMSGLLPGCTNGAFSETLSTGTWTATFYDSDGEALTSCSNTNWREDASEMKVNGNHSNTIRSISMSITPGGIDGECGSRNTTYSFFQSSWPSGSSYCSIGTPSSTPSFPPFGVTVNWQCLSDNGGDDASCSATHGF